MRAQHRSDIKQTLQARVEHSSGHPGTISRLECPCCRPFQERRVAFLIPSTVGDSRLSRVLAGSRRKIEGVDERQGEDDERLREDVNASSRECVDTDLMEAVSDRGRSEQQNLPPATSSSLSASSPAVEAAISFLQLYKSELSGIVAVRGLLKGE